MWPLNSYRWLALAMAGLAACTEGSTEPQVPDLGSPSIAGYPQAGTLAGAGESVGLRVVVLAGAVPVSQAAIEWRVTSGEGVFKIPDFDHPDSVELAVSMTNATGTDGVAQATFIPTVLGSSTVTASAQTDQGAAIGSVDFANTSTDVLITVGDEHWDAPWPAGPQDVTVAVGTPVRWTVSPDYWWSTDARIHSTSEPPGGESFDMSVVRGWALFVPEVSGEWVWEFDDVRVIGSATLTAQ